MRIAPSVKGKDSILNGIGKINEYKIFVHKKCENTIKELCSYRYSTNKTENGRIMPEDRDNHLMDALRYAFFDVKFFKPSLHKAKRGSGDITASDVIYDWGG